VDDPDFAGALCGGEPQRPSSGRQALHKTQQLCRQVQRALNLALAGPTAGEGLTGLFVEEVAPAPDCGHLLVFVALPEARSGSEALAALRRAAPSLRAEVASSITRKRAPELFFVPACPLGGDDE